jgi:putative colanic acid biosynthesis acetyltransferase WcaF
VDEDITVRSESGRHTATDPALLQDLTKCIAYPYPLTWYAKRIVWETVQCVVFPLIPPRTHRIRAQLLRAFGASLARNVVISKGVKVRHPWLLRMDRNSTLGPGTVVYNLAEIRLGMNTVVSQDTYLCAGTHDYTRPDLPLLRIPIDIGSSVWICAGAFIGPGVSIGDGAIVAARAVVMRDVVPTAVVGGNPARFIKWRIPNGVVAEDIR